EFAVVAQAVREVDGVWRLPPPVAATLVGGARIVPAWHFVPFHTIELAPQAGARLDGAPPRLIQGGWRERDRPRGGEAVEAAEQQECGEPAGPKLHGVRRVRLTVPPAWSPPDRTQRPRSSGPSPGAARSPSAAPPRTRAARSRRVRTTRTASRSSCRRRRRGNRRAEPHAWAPRRRGAPGARRCQRTHAAGRSRASAGRRRAGAGAGVRRREHDCGDASGALPPCRGSARVGATARAHSATAPTHRARSAAGPRENRPQARSVAAASAGTG